MNIITIFGKSRSGKNTVGDMVAASCKGTVQMAFADKLKQICGELFNLTHEDMNTEEGKTKPTKFVCPTCPVCKSIDTEVMSPTVAFSSFYDQPVVNHKGPKQVACKACGAIGALDSFTGFWTPRMILQHVGTEGIRRVDQMAWARNTMQMAQANIAAGANLVIVTDGRFRSELTALREVGGVAWRVRRPETDDRSTGIAKHASETEIDGIPDDDFDDVIMNIGSLDDLSHNVRDCLAKASQRAA